MSFVVAGTSLIYYPVRRFLGDTKEKMIFKACRKAIKIFAFKVKYGITASNYEGKTDNYVIIKD